MVIPECIGCPKTKTLSRDTKKLTLAITLKQRACKRVAYKQAEFLRQQPILASLL